jgi:hypothetical protein
LQKFEPKSLVGQSIIPLVWTTFMFSFSRSVLISNKISVSWMRCCYSTSFGIFFLKGLWFKKESIVNDCQGCLLFQVNFSVGNHLDTVMNTIWKGKNIFWCVIEWRFRALIFVLCSASNMTTDILFSQLKRKWNFDFFFWFN